MADDINSSGGELVWRLQHPDHPNSALPKSVRMNERQVKIDIPSKMSTTPASRT
ncbi:MAG: hypothetical protein R2734_01300 [Nocardioides sp.]